MPLTHQPGSARMPPWDVGPLPDAPRWGWRNWAMMIGPGLLSAGAAIGGGEWLMGPVNTGRYGGAILWVTTLSILGQVVYNIEISRYTLYTGEPIMTGKFRLLPGPLFWLFFYLLLDSGSLLPYQAASAATPILSVARGQVPNPAVDRALLFAIACVIYVVTAVPLVFSGKIYTFIKWLMTFKVVIVFGFLLFITFAYSSAATWGDILSGFFKFGTVPVKGESGAELRNVFASLLGGQGLPDVDTSVIASLAAFAAIAGIGGLKNSVISNYTRDQGWGMGAHVGAIPSIVGGRGLQLSHVGTVFDVTPEALPRWRRWLRHVTREQLAVWMVGSLVGVALPAMLSVEFLPRGIQGSDWMMAAMTAEGVQTRVGGGLGRFYWYMLMICGVLVLVPNTVSDADGTVRRWVDLAWTGAPPLRKWDPRRINLFYFWVLVGYVALGVALLLLFETPKKILQFYGCIANFVLGFSAWHTLAVNCTLLPRELRPGGLSRTLLALSGLYFFALAILTLLSFLKVI